MHILKQAFSMYYGLPKEIYVLFVARIINRFGGFVNFFLVLFLTLRVGISEQQAGLYMAIAGMVGLMGTMIGGHIGDCFGRKNAYVIAQGIAATLFIPCGFLGTSKLIPIFLIISSFFSSMVQPLNSAMVNDLVSKEDRKRAFSLLYYGINVGVALGPLVAGFLFYHHIEMIFWGDALTTYIAVFLIYKFIPETKKSHDELKEIDCNLSQHEKMEVGGTISALLKRPLLCMFTFFSILTSFVYAQASFALPMTMTNIFGEKLGSSNLGILMSFNAMIVLIFTIIITKVTDGVKPVFNIAFANILYGLGFSMMAFVHSVPLIAVSVFLWTLGEILGATNSGAYIANHTPITHRSRFHAVISFLQSIGHMLGPLLGGMIITQLHMKSLWILTGILALIAFLGVFKIGLIENKKNEILE